MPYVRNYTDVTFNIETMRDFVKNNRLLEELTLKLYENFDPSSGLLPRYQSKSFEKDFLSTLPKEKTEGILLDHPGREFNNAFLPYDSSFENNLMLLPGVISTGKFVQRENRRHTGRQNYHSLFGEETFYRGVLTVDFIHELIDDELIALNDIQLNDIADLLRANNVKPWFTVPARPGSEDLDKRNAIRVALDALVTSHPIVFTTRVRDELARAGYYDAMTRKEILAHLADVLIPELKENPYDEAFDEEEEEWDDDFDEVEEV